MARFSISGRSTIVPTAALPCVSLYGVTTTRARIIQINIFNTGASAAVYTVNRLTTTGTQGAGLTEDGDSAPEQTAFATGFAGHTVGPTIGAEKQRALIGAGSGVILTWAETDPLTIPALTTAGVGIITPTGTGQIVDYTISWLE